MGKEQKHTEIDKHINDLIYYKTALAKAYQYYHCVRDVDQFKHIEENYGIGSPTSIGFTPLIKKHIDVLVGEYLELDPDAKISCKDEKTASNILRDKKLKIDQELYKYLEGQLHNIIINVFFNNQQSTPDPYIKREMERIIEDVDKSFVSEYEIAAHYLLLHFKQSRDIDLKNKLRILFTDLLITGCCYYRTKETNDGNVDIEILNPLNTFIERNPHEFYLNKSPRAVIRRYLTKEQILDEYGEKMTRSQIDDLDGEIGKGRNDTQSMLVNAYSSTIWNEDGKTNKSLHPSFGILGGLEVTPFASGFNEFNSFASSTLHRTIAVYDTEWTDYSSSKKKVIKYQGTRIGTGIFLYEEPDDNDTNKWSLNLNGMFFLDRNGAPFSLMINTMSLQDKYDILLYYRDNLIATSGTVGDWIDLAHLPAVLGVELPERLEKWLAYKKNGLALFDSSQEGANILNTTFNGFDDTVKGQAIQAIQLAIDSIEMQAAAITGVFPEKLGGIQERDAVSNVKVGIKYSTLLTKQYFNAMDLMLKEVNYDLLNLAKVVYKDGFTGTVILGEKYSQVFTALPEHYTLTDFDIHINDSTEQLQKLETIRVMAMELIKAGMADMSMVVNIASSNSLTELRRYVDISVAQQKQENNQVQQLNQQVQEYENNRKQLEQQLQQLSQQNEQLQKELERNNADKMQLERKRVELEEREIKDKRDYNNKVIETKEKQIQAELAQLYDDNPHNNEIKNNV